MNETEKLEAELLIYFDEINQCIDQSLLISDNYARFRGMMESFKANIHWLEVCTSPSIIRYVNSVTKMLRSEFITLPWKILDCDKEWLPGQLAKPRRNIKRVAGDGVKTLSRASKLFCEAYKISKSIDNKIFYKLMRQNILSNFPDGRIETTDLEKKISKLISINETVSNLTKSDEFTHIKVARHEGIAHSLNICGDRLRDEEGKLDTEFTVGNLLTFGENLMEVVQDFDLSWRSKKRTSLQNLIKSGQDRDQIFWNTLREGHNHKSSKICLL